MSGVVLVALEEALWDWVQSVLPAPWNTDSSILWGDQNAPRAGSQYVELRRGNPFVLKIGRDVQGPVDPLTGSASREGPREINFGIRVYGAGALQILQDVVDRLDDEGAANALYADALALVEAGQLLNLTKLYSSEYKEVAGVDLRFRTHSLREGADAEAGVGYIQLVQLDVDTKGPAGTVISTEQIEVRDPDYVEPAP